MKYSTCSIRLTTPSALVLMVFLLVNSALAGEITIGGPEIGRQFFGIHIHRAEQNNWPAMPVGSLRLWDSGVIWSRLEPQPGQWIFSKLDSIVERAEQRNIEIVMPVGLPPAWASARPNETSPYGSGSSAPPLRMQDWRTYLRKLFSRYQGKIKYYQVWNEANERTFFSGSLGELIELCAVAKDELHRIDPSAKIVSPSFVGEKGIQYLSEFIKQGGGNNVDIIGFHFYSVYADPESSGRQMMTVRGLIDEKLGRQVELWNTETGWLTIESQANDQALNAYKYWRRLDAERLPEYIARALVTSASFGVSRYYWYSWDHKYMGLSYPGSSQVRPGVAEAYATLARWIVGKRIKCSENQSLWRCKVYGGNRVEGEIVWNRTNEATELSIDQFRDAAEFEDILGHRHDVKASRKIKIDQRPIYVRTDSFRR